MNGATVHFEPKPDLRAAAVKASVRFLRMCFLGHMPKFQMEGAAQAVHDAVEALRQSGEEW